MNIQFKKGVLELCVLSMLLRKNRYGYELVNEISKNIRIAEGTIYPLLKRLKDEGYFTTYLEESQEGPPRKYYMLTDKGRMMESRLKGEWFDFVDSVNRIVATDEFPAAVNMYTGSAAPAAPAADTGPVAPVAPAAEEMRYNKDTGGLSDGIASGNHDVEGGKGNEIN